VADDLVRKRLTAIYTAYEKGDLDAVVAAFDDNADFISYVPLQVFPYLGHRAGKEAIAASLRAVRERFDFISYKPSFIVVENDNAAAIIEMRLKQRATDRIINVRLGHFMRFAQGRIIEFREFTDSFDAAEQVIGREIRVS
jgi:ketosteroid isomerase-like protein